MKLRKTLLFMIVAIYSLSFPAAKAAANTPTDAVKYTVDSVLNLLKDKELSAPDKKEERRTRISSLIRERFDFREMARRSLARHWKKRTPEEEKEFVAIFSDLLEASYISKIEAYTDERVTFDKEVIKGKGKYGVVSTTIATKAVDIPIDYKVKFKNGKWWIYDVVVEGVSFVSTYRSQYNKVIVKESFAKLIQRMKNKLNEVNAI
ncbi:MAG TPA: ABC transporter substrate-binding protein [Nitrospirae bacterium]|nr:toluene tolerance, Ttg2 [bacterium BMS3Abin06]HDH11870.1 ABC transporter substrate-binding protein [Nitrospirota bacterium]HDZ02788.1 ABC transporter substrate-binding protein [Nitrospirota bacterium]